ncbi:MAG: IclR family transcriptional regulator [Epulopiscium sp.]|nr:IclR family transcriptional regulator [Candidatus Epulonipiscium sp.]
MKEVVQSVDRALSILEVLSDQETGLGLSEISNQIDLHKSTVHRLLGTLMIRGYVEQDPHTNRYSLTMKLFELGNKKIEKLDVLTLAKPYLRELADKTNEVVHLVIREGAEIIYIDKVEGDYTLRMHSRIGRRSPLYCTAVGKVMMAYLEEEERKKLWEESAKKEYTSFTIIQYSQMQEELKKVKNQGYAVDDQEHEIGVRCIGAPIFDYQGNVHAAISVSGPAIRMTPEKIKVFAGFLLKYGEKISRELGYMGEM